MSTTTTESIELARRIRGHVLRMVHHARASHVGACLSAADVLAVLYSDVLNVDPARPEWSRRDRFLLSKGHAAAAVYAALAERGFFPLDWLGEYCDDGRPLSGHISHHAPGVDFSTGSLGHGLSLGCGVALAARRAGEPQRTFVLLSDGECDEGSIWEAALFAPHHRLDGLTAIIDYNKLQSFGAVDEVLTLEPLADKWRSFGWAVREVDGHDHAALHALFTTLPAEQDRPTAIIAHTVKGRGVSFMEARLAWHYKSPTDAELRAALAELGLES